MINARWIEHVLEPRFELGTSKGPINARTVWYLIAWQENKPEIQGIGEAALFPGHSKEFPADVRTKLVELCANTADWQQRLTTDLVDVPSVRFAVEQCLRDLKVSGTKQLFPSPFTLGKQTIPINGLVWMGDKATMKTRIREQIDKGFTTVKMKIGAIGIDDELELLRSVRAEFSAADITLRVDANGAFTSQNAMDVLERLAELSIHSIEQPVAPGLYEVMAELCERSPLPIGLDEDLIGLNNHDLKVDLLKNVKPQYIVIKPSLGGRLGGHQGMDRPGRRAWYRLVDHQRLGEQHRVECHRAIHCNTERGNAARTRHRKCVCQQHPITADRRKRRTAVPTRKGLGPFLDRLKWPSARPMRRPWRPHSSS